MERASPKACVTFGRHYGAGCFSTSIYCRLLCTTQIQVTLTGKLPQSASLFFNNSDKHATEFFVIITHCKCKMDKMLCLIDAVETYNALEKVFATFTDFVVFGRLVTLRCFRSSNKFYY